MANPNKKWADAGMKAVEAYAEATRNDLKTEGVETMLSDLILALMHTCDARKIDFERCLIRARGHHECESRAGVA